MNIFFETKYKILSKFNPDVIIKTEDEEFSSHKILLKMSSKYFDSLFNFSPDIKIVDLHDINSDIFLFILDHVYSTNNISYSEVKDWSINAIFELMIIIDKLQFKKINHMPNNLGPLDPEEENEILLKLPQIYDICKRDYDNVSFFSLFSKYSLFPDYLDEKEKILLINNMSDEQCEARLDEICKILQNHYKYLTNFEPLILGQYIDEKTIYQEIIFKLIIKHITNLEFLIDRHIKHLIVYNVKLKCDEYGKFLLAKKVFDNDKLDDYIKWSCFTNQQLIDLKEKYHIDKFYHITEIDDRYILPYFINQNEKQIFFIKNKDIKNKEDKNIIKIKYNETHDIYFFDLKINNDQLNILKNIYIYSYLNAARNNCYFTDNSLKYYESFYYSIVFDNMNNFEIKIVALIQNSSLPERLIY